MLSEIEQKVDQLFAQRLSRSSRSTICENPVTGGRFVAKLDPVSEQRRRAVNALKARAWFAEQKPDDAPDLPLTYEERERLKTCGLPYMVSLFARSLAYRDYQTDGHPRFDEYARGVMASPMTPDWIREDKELLDRYPPKPLPGLGGGLIWRGA